MYQLNNDINTINDYLHAQEWLKADEKVISAEKPGDGNMNFTLRCKTDKNRSFIIKQSRDYVEKYPQVKAPANRVLRESEFYGIISSDQELKEMTPDIILADEESNILLMEDLGEGTDFSYLYKKGEIINVSDLREIIHFSANLHKKFNTSNTTPIITNKEMRKLNHEHIFIYPYIDDNGLNLDNVLPGLQSVANDIKKDKALQSAIQSIGELYLADGNVLLHGDYFPGSWLKTNEGIRIIDPEFCFFGLAEFEMGVTMAHLHISGQSEIIISKALQFYKEVNVLDESLMEQFMAVEILRRILGLAQLPLTLTLEEIKSLIEKCRKILTRGITQN